MALSDDLDDLRDQLDSRPPMVKYGDKPELTIPNPDMNNNLDTVVVGGDVAIEAARIAVSAGDDAFASKQSAEQSSVIAFDAATTAVDAKDVVVDAETVVVDAKNAAVQANTDAQEAKDIAVAARDETVEAKDILVPAIDETLEARDQAVAASTTAAGAADMATTKAGEAAVSADLAEFWADAAEASSGVAGLGEAIAALPKIKPILNLDFINQKQLLPGVNFSRATPTWDWDEHGNFRKYEIDEPVFAYDPATGEAKGLQAYPERTNLAIWSGDATNPIWAFSGTREGGQPSLLGGSTATKLTGNSTLLRGIATASVSSVCVRFVFKPVVSNDPSYFFLLRNTTTSTDFVRVDVDISTMQIITTSGPGTHELNSLNNGFYEIIMSGSGFVSGESVVVYLGKITASGDPTWGIIADYIQIEAGTTPTPYIPTEGSQVTVAATNLQIDGDLFDSVYNPKQGAMLFDVGDANIITGSVQSPYTSFGLLGVGDANQTGVFGTNGTSLISRRADGSLPSPYVSLPNSLVGKGGYTFIASYTHDLLSAAVFGELTTQAVSIPDFLENSASRIYVSPLTNGYVKAIKYYNKALPDETLKELTK